MARLPHDLVAAPQGQNSAKDPAALGPLEAQQLVNFIPDRLGVIRGNVRNVDLTFTPSLSTNIYGVGWLSQEDVVLSGSGGGTPTTPQAARIAYSDGTQLSSYALVSPADGGGTLTYPPTFDNKGGTIGVFTNKKCRFAAFGDELFAVQDQNDVSNYRMLSNGDWFEMGLPAPGIALSKTNNIAASNKTGTVEYSYTIVDNMGRESSLSPVILTVAYGATPNFYVTLDASATLFPVQTDAFFLNVYATAGNGDVFYQIGTIPQGGPYTLDDNFADAIVEAGAIAPNFGQNDQPLPASIICVHKNRVWMNVNSDSGAIQASNFGSPTQFSTTGELLDVNGQLSNPNDGATFRVSSDIGNDITGFASLGTLLVIGRKTSIWGLFGDSLLDFIPRRISHRGNCSPDAMIGCENEVLFLSYDGVYSIGGNFEDVKVSADIEDKILTLAATTAGRALMDAATAFFIQRHYVLCIGTAMYAFNVDTRKWYTFAVGVTVNCAVVAYPPGSPALALMGRTDAHKISILDLISTNVATTGMIKRGRLIDLTLPYKERSEMGQQEPRAATKRVKRWYQYGSGSSITGTISLNVDGRTDTYTLSGAMPWRGILFSQEFPVNDLGYAIDFTISLNGTGVILSDELVEGVLIG